MANTSSRNIPTAADYMSAILATNIEAPSPTSYAPLLDSDNNPITLIDTSDGFLGAAFYNQQTRQIIISLEGSAPLVNPYGTSPDTAINRGAQASDFQIYLQQKPTAIEQDLQNFVTNIQNAAKVDGLSGDSRNIFVTGHSLGGYITERAAEEYDFGGAAFGAPGIPNEAFGGSITKCIVPR